MVIVLLYSKAFNGGIGSFIFWVELFRHLVIKNINTAYSFLQKLVVQVS
jgi:hypothetical protein